MSETDGDFIAYSKSGGAATEVVLYKISTGISSVIYNDLTGGDNAENIKIFNGKISWSFGRIGVYGVWMYNIGTATTKTVTLSLNVNHNQIDHNGDHLVWQDLVTGDINIFDFI